MTNMTEIMINLRRCGIALLPLPSVVTSADGLSEMDLCCRHVPVGGGRGAVGAAGPSRASLASCTPSPLAAFEHVPAHFKVGPF